MKIELRKNMIEVLKQLESEERAHIENQLFHHLTSSLLWKNAETIGMTMSQSFEWDTRPLIELAWNENKRVAIPRSISATKTMTFHEINHFHELTIGYGNIEEPDHLRTAIVNKEEIDLLIVPGLLFNKSGYRIGFGGGYYDRYLADFPKQTVGLISEMQLNNAIPVNHYDIPVQYIVTESGLFQTSDG